MVRISVGLHENTWKRLRHVAEDRRVSGRASLSQLIAKILEGALAEMDGVNREQAG
jgi:hypothetical protein